MKWERIYLVVLLFCSSCTDTSIEPIDRYILLHDNSSKVWLLDKQLEGEKDFTPLQFQYKELFIFHDSHVVCLQRIHDLGKPAKKMTYTLDQTNNELRISDAKDLFVFKVVQLSRKRLVLETRGKQVNQQLILIPFPEY